LVLISHHIVPDQFFGAFLPITQVVVPVVSRPFGVCRAILILTYLGRLVHFNRNWAKNSERSPPMTKGLQPAKVVHAPGL
jgi:hypothetical protein